MNIVRSSIVLVVAGAMACGARTGLDAPDGSGPHDAADTPPSDADAAAARVLMVSTGSESSCVLRANGHIACWGDNRFGQLGDGRSDHLCRGAAFEDCSSVAVPVAGIDNAVAIASGAQHTCAIRGDGTVWCWGNNTSGALGDGTLAARAGPVRVLGIADATALSGYDTSTCALRRNGEIACWGFDTLTAPGPCTIRGACASPVPIGGIHDAIAVGGGLGRLCAVQTSGRVLCWGSDIARPASVATSSPAATVSIEGPACAGLANGAVQCWGQNGSGELGDGTTNHSDSPVDVLGIHNATAITTGSVSACALLGDGAVSCWGGNGVGQLGDGTTMMRTAPVPVRGLQSAVSVAAGWVHACAALADGRVMCWGDDRVGELGNGESNTTHAEPVTVLGL